MAKIEIWDRPVSHWHMKMFSSGSLVCQTFNRAGARSIVAKISPTTIQSIFTACAELGNVKHDPEIYNRDVIVVYAVNGSEEYNLILRDFDAQPSAQKFIENILNRVVTETDGMSGLVELDGML